MRIRWYFALPFLMVLFTANLASAAEGTVYEIILGQNSMSVSLTGGLNLCSTGTSKTQAYFAVGNEGITSDTFRAIHETLLLAKLNTMSVILNAGNANANTSGRCSGQSIVFYQNP